MELEFRKKIDELFHRVEKAFDTVDPDVAECEQGLGTLTITLSDQSRCILSTQPSVKQLWLALASQGIAYHFNFDAQAQAWMDDKGRGIELLSFLSRFFKQEVGLELRF
ncbi:MAG: iron donor protein CyaY [Bdellovibrionia bacterium]